MREGNFFGKYRWVLVAESRYAQRHTVCDKAKVLRRGSAFLRNVESACGGVEGSLHWFVKRSG